MFSDDVTAVKVKFKKMVDASGILHSKLVMSLLNNIYTAEMFKESTMGVGVWWVERKFGAWRLRMIW
jgi:hypothetical protein